MRKEWSDEAWSRRIDDQNRIVYDVVDGRLLIASCLGHYEE